MAGQATPEKPADIIGQIKTPPPIKLSSRVVVKGIDSYHIDVELAKPFVAHTGQVIADQVKRIVGGKRMLASNSNDMERLRDLYRDMMEASLHRVKTDLSPDQFLILQFAVVKFVIQEVKARLDEMLKQLEETQAQQKFSGSRSLLATQERFAWFRRRYGDFFYHVNRQIMRQLHRAEVNHLRALRSQFLVGAMPQSVNLLFNPMLSARGPGDLSLLMEYYTIWPGGTKGFNRLNEQLEKLLGKAFKGLDRTPLYTKNSGQNEVYDEFRGHFALQPYLGPALDQKDEVEEDFCWLEHPGHMRLLFDANVHERTSRQLKEEAGIIARLSFNRQSNKLLKTADRIRKKIPSQDLRQMMASYLLRENWSIVESEVIDLDLACQYIAGINSKKVAARFDRGKEGALDTIDKLDELARRFQKEQKQDVEEKFLRILSDWSRFRLHLKYFRFAHRMFNRINVITDAEKAHLSRSGGHLYQLLGEEEVKSAPGAEPRIVHHTILKADVRGSTTVTQELIKKELNPASYFSVRFFGPITELLEVYGAVKVFIEGDAVILGLYEYDNNPLGWYSVSRACGIAKEMLDIVGSKNAHSRQTGLPLLEIGIGICYSDETPLFLFDDNKPIMISPAIGDADRLSSCSWRLRESFKNDTFNVEVLEIGDGDGAGEKGQQVIRYNVNGITLDEEAFRKLSSEITLRRLSIKTGEINQVMYVGRFPDVRGKERELVIREGRVGIWKNEQVVAGQSGDKVFYEVLPNSKFASQVLEVARRQSVESA